MTREDVCLHDAEIIGYSLDIEKQIFDFQVRIVFPETNGKIAKIHFDEMIGFLLEDLNHQNVILDIEKGDIVEYFQENKEMLENTFNYSLCINLYSYTFDEILQYLQKNNFFVYYVNSSNGLSGVVFAKNIQVFYKNKSPK